MASRSRGSQSGRGPAPEPLQERDRRQPDTYANRIHREVAQRRMPAGRPRLERLEHCSHRDAEQRQCAAAAGIREGKHAGQESERQEMLQMVLNARRRPQPWWPERDHHRRGKHKPRGHPRNSGRHRCSGMHCTTSSAIDAEKPPCNSAPQVRRLTIFSICSGQPLFNRATRSAWPSGGTARRDGAPS